MPASTARANEPDALLLLFLHADVKPAHADERDLLPGAPQGTVDHVSFARLVGAVWEIGRGRIGLRWRSLLVGRSKTGSEKTHGRTRK